MQDVSFAIPGDLNSRTGGYNYDRRILGLLSDFGVRVRHLALSSNFPHPLKADVEEALRSFREIPAGHVLLIDGLAFAALPLAVLSQIQVPIVALIHHPLSFEAGLSSADRAHFMESEKLALTKAAHIVVSSATTARLLVECFKVHAARITTAEPGTEKALRTLGSPAESNVLLAVGSVIP